MRYCTNCGNPLDEAAAFCPSCGHAVAKTEEVVTEAAETVTEAAEQTAEAAAEAAAPIMEEAAPAAEPAPEAAPAKTRKKMKPIAVIAIVLAALAAIAAVLWATGVFRKLLPDSRVKLGLAEKALVDSGLDAYFDAQDKVEELKYDLNITAGIESDQAGMFSEIGIIKSILDSVSIDVKLDVKGEMPSFGLGINYQNNRVLDATVISEGDKFGLYIPQLDKNYYTITREKLTELITADADELEIGGLLENDSFDLKLDEEKTRKEIDDLLMICGKLSTEENTVIEKDVEVKLYGGEKTVNGTRFTITPNKEQFAAVIKQIGEYLSREDCYLGGLIRKMAVYDEEGNKVEDPFAEMVNNSETLADKVMKTEPKLVAVMVEGDVVSNTVITKDATVVCDHEPKVNDAERVYVTVDSEGKRELEMDANYATINDTTVKGVIKITGEEIGDAISVAIDLDGIDSKKLTANGSVKVSFADAEILTMTFTPEGEKNRIVAEFDVEKMITVSMQAIVDSDPDIDYDDLEDAGVEVKKIILNVLAAPGTGVEAPKDIEPTDLSNATEEEISEIFENMFSELEDVLSGMLF